MLTSTSYAVGGIKKRSRQRTEPVLSRSYRKGTHPPFRLFLTFRAMAYPLTEKCGFSPRLRRRFRLVRRSSTFNEQCCRRSTACGNA